MLSRTKALILLSIVAPALAAAANVDRPIRGIHVYHDTGERIRCEIRTDDGWVSAQITYDGKVPNLTEEAKRGTVRMDETVLKAGKGRVQVKLEGQNDWSPGRIALKKEFSRSSSSES